MPVKIHLIMKSRYPNAKVISFEFVICALRILMGALRCEV